MKVLTNLRFLPSQSSRSLPSGSLYVASWGFATQLLSNNTPKCFPKYPKSFPLFPETYPVLPLSPSVLRTRFALLSQPNFSIFTIGFFFVPQFSQVAPVSSKPHSQPRPPRVSGQAENIHEQAEECFNICIVPRYWGNIEIKFNETIQSYSILLCISAVRNACAKSRVASKRLMHLEHLELWSLTSSSEEERRVGSNAGCPMSCKLCIQCTKNTHTRESQEIANEMYMRWKKLAMPTMTTIYCRGKV